MYRTTFSLTTIVILTLCVTTACSAQQQTEEQALASLRQISRNGEVPTDQYLSGIESRFAGKRTGLLAKLLHAKTKFDNKDFTGAAALLNTPDFATKTRVADHALWLRGRSLQEAGNHAPAMQAFEQLVADYPGSLRATDARLRWAASAIAAGQTSRVPDQLRELSSANNGEANFLIAKAYDSQGNTAEATRYYRRAYFYAAGTDAAKQSEARLTAMSQPLDPQSSEEALQRADLLFNRRDFTGAEKAYLSLATAYPAAMTTAIRLRQLTTFASLRKTAEAQNVFNSIPESAREKEEAYYQLTMAFARARQWAQARATAQEMRTKFPSGELTPKAWIDAGYVARDARIKSEEQSFLSTAVSSFPNAVEVAGAQFELAWLEHDSKNFTRSSTMLVEHLARYAAKDNTNRGKAGYWAARDSERAGKLADACALYEGVVYRYSANWYGYLADQRLDSMKSRRQCPGGSTSPLVQEAVAALRPIIVAAETSTPRELDRAEKSDELSAVGIFDWAIDELEEAKRTAQNSPKINLALARHYRLKGDNVNALLALAKSYPDYSQMFPEEMGREEWDIFYPLTNWKDITYWAAQRKLDKYQVAGLIRQESVFNPRAKSGANAYGLMQLLIPTARTTARKYGSSAIVSADSLFQPATNIELGTAFMRDQFDKFGRIEYVAVAYNAGPGRVSPWRASLPLEIDEFVEAIPFRETKGYVQGIIRNSAQYRRLYDDNGEFKSNVGTKALRGEIDSKPADQIAAEFPDVVVRRDAKSEE